LRSCQVQSQSSPHASALAGKSVANSSIARFLNFSTAKSREQSQNVYENKGQRQNVDESRVRGPRANHIPQVASLKVSDCPSTFRLLNFSTTKPCERTGNVYEKNGKDKMSLTRVHDFARSPLRVRVGSALAERLIAKAINAGDRVGQRHLVLIVL